MTLSATSTSVGSVDLVEAMDVASDKSESARAGCARVMADAVRWVYLAAVADMSELLMRAWIARERVATVYRSVG